MKRFLLERPLKQDERDLEIWICDKHYESFLKSKNFRKLASEYDCIVILEGVDAIPHMCWCCAQNDGNTADFLTYNGDQFLCQVL